MNNWSQAMTLWEQVTIASWTNKLKKKKKKKKMGKDDLLDNK